MPSKTSHRSVRFEHHEYMLFRYATIVVTSRILPKKLDVSAWFVRYDYDPSESSFTSSSASLNRVWELCRNTIERTSLDTATDSNTRERLPYEADLFITAQSYMSLQSDRLWTHHSMRQCIVNPTWPTEWRQHIPLLAHLDYMQTGDLSLYRDFRDSMLSQTQVDCVNGGGDPEIGLVDFTACDRQTGGFGAQDEGVLKEIVDWPQSTRDGYVLTDVNTVVNSFAVGSLDAMAEMAHANGDDDFAQDLQRRSTSLRDAMNRRLLDSARGCYADGLNTTTYEMLNHSAWLANVMPMAFDIPPDSARRDLFDYFVSTRGNKIVGSVYSSYYYLRALYRLADDHDFGAAALKVLSSNASNRSWIGMINSGATTTMEAWNVVEKPNLSWSHPWASAPASAVVWGLFGLVPLEPGFTTFLVKPRPGDLLYASIKLPTYQLGPIYASFVQNATSKNFALKVTVPVRSRAVLSLPVLFGLESKTLCINGVKTDAELSENRRFLITQDPIEGNGKAHIVSLLCDS